MKYKTADATEAKEARWRLDRLIEGGKVVEIKEIRPGRSLSQNNYLHLILGAFGVHFGLTIEEAKQVYKNINKEIYRYEKKGKEFMRSSADLNIADMSASIEMFKRVSAEAGCPLPNATDMDWLRRIENEIERNRRYL